MNWDILIVFLGTAMVLTLSPGPDILYLLTVSIQEGQKAAVKLGLGLTTGLFFHTAVVALGWSQFLQTYPEFLQSIQWGGALYLCYLAYAAFRRNRLSNAQQPLRKRHFFRQGLLMNLTNPKVTLFFMVFFPGFLFSDHLSYPVQLSLLGGLFWFQAVVIFMIVARLGAVYQRSKFYKVTQKHTSVIEGIILLAITISIVASI